MKKIILFLSATLSLSLAATDAQIKKFYDETFKEQLNKPTLKILKREKVEGSDFEAVVISLESDKMKIEDMIFTKGDIIVPDIIDLKKNISYKQSYEVKKMLEQKQEFSKKALNELKKEKMLISLGDSKKPLVYIFSDPECPYCRMHLKNVRNDLKTHQIKLILTPVHGLSAFEKSALIYKEIKKAKNDEDKIKILEKYYSEKLPSYTEKSEKGFNVSKKEVEEVVKLYQTYNSLGLSAVPMILEAK